jgi:hypothetical protein
MNTIQNPVRWYSHELPRAQLNNLQIPLWLMLMGWLLYIIIRRLQEP